MQVIKCDKCGTEIENVWYIKTFSSPESSVPIKEYELCSNCYHKLKDLLKKE